MSSSISFLFPLVYDEANQFTDLFRTYCVENVVFYPDSTPFISIPLEHSLSTEMLILFFSSKHLALPPETDGILS